MERKSEYFSSLSASAKDRYEKKVMATGLKVDPYSIERWHEDSEVFPEVNWSDMMIYLTATPSKYTREAIKAWKGMLDGGCFMRAGWVHDLKIYPYSEVDENRFVIMGKVKHSQRMSAGFLLPWVIAKQKGEILATHCTCMAGLGEACSHVAAVLSCIIKATELRKQSGMDACTSSLCRWNHSTKEVKPVFFGDIKFYGQNSRKRCLANSVDSLTKKVHETSSECSEDDCSLIISNPTTTSSPTTSNSCNPTTTSSVTSSSNPTTSNSSNPTTTSSATSSSNPTATNSSNPTTTSSITSSSNPTTNDSSNICDSTNDELQEASAEEQEKLFSTVNQATNKPAILRIVQPFAANFVPTVTLSTYPKLLTELYDQSALSLSYPELLKKCETVYHSYKVTKDQCLSLEAITRNQSLNKTWFSHRTGRITASTFKSAAVTNVAMPSQSLIKRLCYPEAHKFTTAPTRWGCTHEKDALAAYSAMMVKQHQDFKVEDAGLFIDHLNPFLGASPDGIAQCTCCGHGVVEVKCPFCFKDDIPEDDKKFCMAVNSEGSWKLKTDHSYYYQVQLQLHVCDVAFADFVVWTKNRTVIERVYEDKDFFDSKFENVRHFFIYGILPEIVGKWYTRTPVADSDHIVPLPTANSDTADTTTASIDDDTDGRLWCYCNQPSFGDMVMCDNKNCTIQ